MKSKEETLSEIDLCKEYIETYKKYLLMCMELGDWHGVEDAASDIRDTEARIRALEWVLEQ